MNSNNTRHQSDTCRNKHNQIKGFIIFPQLWFSKLIYFITDVQSYSLCIYNYKLMYTYHIISKITDVNYTNLDRHNSNHAPTSSSLLNTHEISYPHPTPNPTPPYTRRTPKYSCLQVCCQSINLKMAIRAKTCSWYPRNKQHIYLTTRQLCSTVD